MSNLKWWNIQWQIKEIQDKDRRNYMKWVKVTVDTELKKSDWNLEFDNNDILQTKFEWLVKIYLTQSFKKITEDYKERITDEEYTKLKVIFDILLEELPKSYSENYIDLWNKYKNLPKSFDIDDLWKEKFQLIEIIWTLKWLSNLTWISIWYWLIKSFKNILWMFNKCWYNFHFVWDNTWKIILHKCNSVYAILAFLFPLSENSNIETYTYTQNNFINKWLRKALNKINPRHYNTLKEYINDENYWIIIS
jgi:hypothetical protein